MSGILIKRFPLRSAFSVRQLPFLARFYRDAYHGQTTGRAGFWLSRILTRFFRIYRRFCGSSVGEFDYERLGRRATIRFNARNVQFQALYAPYFKYGYEPEVGALLDLMLPEAGTFLDIGSNWGYFTLYAASNHSRLTVHAFEPMPATYKDLTSCVEQAGLSSLVTCHNLALSSADGEAFIQIPDGLHSGIAEVSKLGGTARIATWRLDSLGLPRPDFIKMDVEGHEIEVLNGAKETLKASRPFIIFESKPDYLHTKKTLEVLFFLTALGYQFYVPAVQRQLDGQSYYMQCAGFPIGDEDELALVPFEAGTRLLWQHDINVFACHESRQQELMTMFKACP
ncbi:MAG: FkbM family methyltransferase [Verrucomicrobiia bacterium]